MEKWFRDLIFVVGVRMLGRCGWKDGQGKRCKCVVRKEEDRFCKRHDMKYEYQPEGIRNVDGCLVVCDNIRVVRMKIRSVDDVVSLRDKIFLDRDGVEYMYEGDMKDGETYVMLKNGTTELMEMFWNSVLERGRKNGRLVKELSVKGYKENCEKTALICINGESLCEECFEKGYNTLLDYFQMV